MSEIRTRAPLYSLPFAHLHLYGKSFWSLGYSLSRVHLIHTRESWPYEGNSLFVCGKGVRFESPLKAPPCRPLAREAIFFSAQDNDINVEGENVVDMNSSRFWQHILSLLNGFSLHVSGRFPCLNI